MHMKSRRPGSKGTEWLLIKHRDAYVQPGYDIDKYDYSVLTKRSLKADRRRRGLGRMAEQPQGVRPAAAPARTTGWPTRSPKPTPRRRRLPRNRQP